MALKDIAVRWRKRWRETGRDRRRWWWIGGAVCVLLGLMMAVFVGPTAEPQRAVKTVETRRAAIAAVPLPGAEPEAEAMQPPVDTREGEPSVSAPEQVSGEVQLERRFRSMIEAAQSELPLNRAEVDRLVADFMEFQEVNAEVIARQMQETTYDPTSVTVHVPAFPVEGRALRELFHQRLRKDFTPEQFARIDAQLGQFIEAAFRGFGIAEQTYTIVKNPAQPGAFEVRTEVIVPDGVVTTASNPDVAFGGVSDAVLVTREQLTTGEYRFLGPIVEKRFSQ